MTNEDWYKGAVEQKNIYISKVKVDPSSSSPVISMSSAIKSKFNDTLGVLNLDISLVSLTQTITNMSIGKQGYAFVCDPSGTIIAHKDFNMVKSKTNMMEHSFVKEALKSKSGFTIYTDKTGKKQFVAYGRHKTTGWGVLSAAGYRGLCSCESSYKTTMITAGIMLVLSLEWVCLSGTLCQNRLCGL